MKKCFTVAALVAASAMASLAAAGPAAAADDIHILGDCIVITNPRVELSPTISVEASEVAFGGVSECDATAS